MNSLPAALAVAALWLATTAVRAEDAEPVSGEKRMQEIEELAAQNPAEALKPAENWLAQVRADHVDDPQHAAIGRAAGLAGTVATMAGKHEKAVPLLQEALPILSGTRGGTLLADEAGYGMALATSFDALKRPEDALGVLRDLLARTRKELARNPPDSGLKGITDDGQSIPLSSITASEEWVVNVQERIGMLQLEAENWAEAETALKEADEILTRKRPDEGQARLVKLREGWERAAREQGKAIRPQQVGRFGNPRGIHLVGALQVPEQEIHSALNRSSAYMLASHPSAPLDPYLQTLQRCLELGYLSAGFPDATTEVDWSETENKIVASIKEGQRFTAGTIRIRGATVLAEAAIIERLILKEDAEPAPIAREELAFLKVSEKKGLPPELVQDTVAKVFPGSLPQKKEEEKDTEFLPGFPELTSSSDTSAKGVWREGKWVNFQPSFQVSVEAVLRAAYAEQGRFFPQFEVNIVPRSGDGEADLEVLVREEGPAARLRTIHIVGNRINSREEMLASLELEEGMELKGDFMGRVRRKLYDSGRFLGWQVLSQRTQGNSIEMDLLVQVAEQWEAPSLSEPLSREQETMLRFSKWWNTEAGVKDALVFSASAESKTGPVGLEFVVSQDGVAFSADALEHHVRSVVESTGLAEIVIGSDQGSVFRAAFPNAENKLQLYAQAMELVPSDPFGKTGSFNFGMGMSSSDPGEISLALDPACALKLCGSGSGCTPYFEGGEMVVEVEDEGANTTLRFDERTGRLNFLQGNSEGALLTVTTEVGAVARVKKEMKALSKGAPNWLEDRQAESLVVLAMGYAVELMKEASQDAGFTAGTLARAAGQTRPWTPVATILGEVLGILTGEDAAASDEEFTIPFDPEKRTEQLQGGSTMSLLLALGVFDGFAEYLEPGSWPDLVAREILFYLDGKPHYLQDTVQTLLEDDSMGPLGCLLCARLLKYAGNGSATAFANKARGELNRIGFAKDWTLALQGSARDDGPGWRILKSLQKLTEEEIDGIFPADPPELRATLKDLVAEVRDIIPQTRADALAPVLGSLWDKALNPVMEQVVDDTIEDLTPKVDASVIAAVVNGLPVFRAAVKTGEMMDVGRQDPMGWSSLDRSVNTLLLAQKMWSTNRAAQPEFIEARAEVIADLLGGWEKILGTGLSKEQFHWWVGATLAAEAQINESVAASKLTDLQAREFHEKHPMAFGAGQEVRNVCTIILKVEGDGAAQRKLAGEILERVQAAGDLKTMSRVFDEERKKHALVGESKWVAVNVDEFVPSVVDAISKIPDESLSDVISLKIAGQDYLCLVLIPEKRRPGRATPFEEVKDHARSLAIVHSEMARLRKIAQIEVLPEPGPGKGKDPTKQEDQSTFAKFVSSFTPLPDAPGTDPAKQDKKDTKKEPWSLESVLEKAAQGSAPDLYLVGTYAEQGLLPESGLEIAITRYQKAAEGGEPRAMLRLAELHRIGRGVARDPEMSTTWRTRAAASSSLSAGGS